MRGAAILLATLMLPAALPAQGAGSDLSSTVIPGMKVRLTAPSLFAGPLTRRVAVTRPDTLVLEPRGEEIGYTVVPISIIETLEVNRGNRGARVGGTLGGLAGLAAGVVILNKLAEADSCTEGLGCLDRLTEEMAGAVFLSVVCIAGGGMLGFGLGTVVGHLIVPDSWESVPRDRLRVGIAPRTARSVTVGMTVSF